MASNDNDKSMGARAVRVLITTALIVVVTFFWVLMLVYTNLPVLVLAAIALVSLLTLSVATAWTAIAFPKRKKR